jgi:hypothetical protein
VFVISPTLEPFIWFPIFVLSAALIALSGVTRVFLHGVWIGIANSIWITACHVIFFTQYAASHPAEMNGFHSSPINPRLLMLIVGPAIGVISGAVLGVFAVVATKILRRPSTLDADPSA